MGIRFYCPNGHKLNVKEFQAGRLGICPFCGARSQIPTQSTRPSSKAAGRRGAPNANAHNADEDDPDSSPDILPGEPPSLPGDPDLGKMLGPSRPLDVSAGGPVVAPPSQARKPDVQPGQVGKPEIKPSPAAKPDVGQPGIRESGNLPPSLPPDKAARQIGNLPHTTPAQSAATAAPATPAASEPPDPIAEAPDMIWYVRPPSGGQFGPATGELMRSWLGEGRVSADSLVWREGWRDWQEAGAVFAKLRANQIVDFLETTPVVSIAAAAAHAHRPKASAKRSSDYSQLAILVGLSLLVIVLLSVLIWIVTHP
jgi:hypothetical protein